ncbi:MAG: hypothetical protein ABJD75_05915 [Parasphingorhabdus sp.]|uniref:hypothetical protein n=1 Tax=Parasphingorhabdus sp. TaxID=2709688 RepID=UPI003262E119
MLTQTTDQLVILERIEQRLDRIENNLGNPSVDRLQMLSFALNLRQVKNSSFPSQLFSTNAWDILLELYAAHLASKKLSMSAIGQATNISETTMLRYFDILMKHGFIYREDDAASAEKSHVQLTKSAISKLNHVLDTAVYETPVRPAVDLNKAE